MNIKLTENERLFIETRVKQSLTKYNILHHNIIEIIETAYIQGMFDAAECLYEITCTSKKEMPK